jgi:hypothetical protein
MPNFEFLALEVKGHASVALPNRFLKQTGESRALLVMLPGLNYSCDNPLFFYTTSICLAHAIDVLQLWANYNLSAFQSLPEKEQLAWLVEEATALIQSGRAQRDYAHLILVGKSISTLTLGALFGDADDYLSAHAIWLTPLMRFPGVVRGMSRARSRSLFIGGSADRSLDTNLLGNFPRIPDRENLVIEGADHALQIPGDLPRSLDAMKTIVAAVEAFLTSALAE